MFNYDELEKTLTENGAVAYNTTNSAIYNMFALGGAYRSRSEEDIVALFSKAFKEDKTLALKCLYYLRDIRGGQGERRFFRVAFEWLADNAPITATRLLKLIPEYGRWDDLWLLFDKRGCNKLIADMIKEEIAKEETSLIFKWLPSENTSSKETRMTAKKIRKYLGMSSKEYRKMLSAGRKKLTLLETQMSSNEWDAIEFGKLPSVAGMRQMKTFWRREETKERYEAFVNNKTTKVNAGTLYPYDIVKPLADVYQGRISEQEEISIQKYWDNMPDHCQGKDLSALCVIDVSGSMCGLPMQVATSLGIYCSERQEGKLKNKTLTFSKDPHFVDLEGCSTVAEKYRKLVNGSNVGYSTNLVKVFGVLKEAVRIAFSSSIPKNLIVISDMEIDDYNVEDSDETAMEQVRKDWAAAGLTMPHLIYWNVDAREDTILERGDGTTLVSGCSPVILESILTGKTGYDLMLEKLNSERYKDII